MIVLHCRPPEGVPAAEVRLCAVSLLVADGSWAGGKWGENYKRLKAELLCGFQGPVLVTASSLTDCLKCGFLFIQVFLKYGFWSEFGNVCWKNPCFGMIFPAWRFPKATSWQSRWAFSPRQSALLDQVSDWGSLQIASASCLWYIGWLL